jgi:hypothetical protein
MRSIVEFRLHLVWLQAVCLLLPCSSTGAQSGPDVAAASPAQSLLGGGGGGVLELAPPTEPSRSKRRVYVCRDGGTPVFTDRPCGLSARVHDIPIAAPTAGGAVSLAPPTPSASTRPRLMPAPAADAVTPGQARCTALRERLAAIDDQMRSGYSAREAARLWQRWRDARARLRAQHC